MNMNELASPPSLPVRSRLYSPEPVGIGTGMVESLASYLSRLADAHMVSAADLMGYMEWEPTAEVKLTKNHRIYNLMRLRSRELNATQQIARHWSMLVATHTLRNDIDQLTLLPWQHVLTPRTLLHSSQRWCAHCLDDRLNASLAPYWPLLWSLHAVTVCPLHQAPLEWQCHHCGAIIPSLTAQGRVGYCPKCANWLGFIERPDWDGQIRKNCHWLDETGLHLAQGAYALLAASSLSQGCVESNKVSHLLRHCLEATHCRQVVLAQQIGLSALALSRLIRGGELVSVPTLLKVFTALGLEAQDFAAKRAETLVSSGRLDAFISRLANKWLPAIQSRLLPHRRASPALLSEVAVTLEAALAEDDPPSLAALARQVGLTTVKVLWGHYPQLCSALIAKRQARFNLETAACVLEQMATSSEMPPSLATIALQLKTSPVSLARYFPAWVAAIKARRHVVGNVEDLRHSVEAFLQVEPPLSFSAVCERLGIKAHHVRQHCPDLHQALVQRFAAYKHDCAIERERQTITAVRHAVVTLYGNGQHPTKHKVAALLGKTKRLILEKTESEAFTQIMDELGLWRR